MLDWLKGLFRGLESRDIFQYWDGRRYRRCDPWTVYRATVDDPKFEWDTTPKLIAMDAVDDDSLRIKLDAVLDAATMVRRVFDVRPLDKGGLTEAECLELLWRFSAYVGSVKKNTRRTPISLPPSESHPEDTKPDSVSGSTDTEQEHEMLSGSPKESTGG